VISEWSKRHYRKSIPLVVAHTHAHGDHHWGDAEFVGRPHTVAVGLDQKDVAEFFKITDWPRQIVKYDLGGRILHIIPTPGHEASHIMVFDEQTRTLQSGDACGPYRLYFSKATFAQFRDSIDRVVEFTRTRNVSHILSNHVEMARTPGNLYPQRAPSHPDERAMELPYSDLLELQESLHAMKDGPVQQVHNDFVVSPTPF
jgi:glyoxylase-like metal-dependent hydrolase (beta-lactamase superfamily II)